LIVANVLRAGDRGPVLRLRQGYGACTLLGVVLYHLGVTRMVFTHYEML